MKLSSLALVVLVSILCETIAFQASHRCSTKVRPTTHLNMQGMERGFWGSVVGSVVGLAFAGQVATAAIPGTECSAVLSPLQVIRHVDFFMTHSRISYIHSFNNQITRSAFKSYLQL